MSEDLVPIKVDLKANLKVDSKDMANCFNKLLDTIQAPFSWWAKNREPISKEKAETKAARIRVKAAQDLMTKSGLRKKEAESLVLRSNQRNLLQWVFTDINRHPFISVD